MKTKYIFCFLCIAWLLAGCASSPSEETTVDTWSDGGSVTVGGQLTIQNIDSPLALLSNMDALSADGLYYASWTMGSPEPFENSDGDTVDLYDAQLYLLLGESSTNEAAETTMGKWLAAAKTNYEVLEEKAVICNGQLYTIISYRCISEDNPYARGISAFGTHGCNAVCIEFTCQEGFDEPLEDILTGFLDSCTYHDA